MHHTTLAYLRATAKLVRTVQSSPTKSVLIRERRRSVGSTQAQWVNAGCPDLPGDVEAPMVPTVPDLVVDPRRAAGKRTLSDRDWDRVSLICEVVEEREKAVRVNAGDQGKHWIPRSVIRLGGKKIGDRLSVGDFEEYEVPRWVLE